MRLAVFRGMDFKPFRAAFEYSIEYLAMLAYCKQRKQTLKNRQLDADKI
jgi:hypothetical protein